MKLPLKSAALLAVALSLTQISRAQDDEIPLILPEERNAVDNQAAAFNTALAPALSGAARSTVRVWSGSRRLAYGTVIGDGTRILTKWSEIARGTKSLRVDVAGTDYRDVEVTGIYPDEDVAVLKVGGAPLVPVKWATESPRIGGFIAAPQPDGRPAAFGVVSVLERNLRDTDKAYLGVYGDPDHEGPGVRIFRIADDSPARSSGLKVGDVILKIGERPISGLLELKNALNGVSPGSKVSVVIEWTGGTRTLDVVLGNRPQIQQFAGQRLQIMERMGGAISQVRDSFPRAIQTDMRPKPNQIGGPVVDLKGRVVGITIARADRTRSFVMPAAAVIGMLEKKPVDPPVWDDGTAVAAADRRPGRRVVPPASDGADDESGREPRGRMMPESRLRRHLGDMERLVEQLRDEMEALEQP